MSVSAATLEHFACDKRTANKYTSESHAVWHGLHFTVRQTNVQNKMVTLYVQRIV